jgi:hypothetical protein
MNWKIDKLLMNKDIQNKISPVINFRMIVIEISLGHLNYR